MIDPDKISFGGNIPERIQKAAANFKLRKQKEIKPLPGAREFLIWQSQEAMEIWLFCSTNHVTQAEWITAYKKLFGKDPESRLFYEPSSHAIENNGSIPSIILDGYQSIINGKKNCRICWNSGFAYSPGGILLDERLLPGLLKRLICWCRKV